MPIFESVFPPPHDKVILRLLFTLTTWHSLAKLCQHTESTLKHLEAVTSDLGNQLRNFLQTTCAHYRTVELPKEEAACGC